MLKLIMTRSVENISLSSEHYKFELAVIYKWVCWFDLACHATVLLLEIPKSKRLYVLVNK